MNKEPPQLSNMKELNGSDQVSALKPFCQQILIQKDRGEISIFAAARAICNAVLSLDAEYFKTQSVPSVTTEALNDLVDYAGDLELGEIRLLPQSEQEQLWSKISTLVAKL